MADEGDRAAVELAEPGDDGAVVHPAAVAVELDPVLEDPFDVVERVGPLRVPGELDEPPDLVLGRIHARDRVELLLEPPFLARDARAVEERQAPQPAEPLPQRALGLTGQRAGGAAPGRGAALIGERLRRSGRSGRCCSARPKSSESFSFTSSCTTRGPVKASRAPGSATITSPSVAKLAIAPPVVGSASRQKNGSPGLVELVDRGDRLRQLHQREDSLLHARAARARDEQERDAGGDRGVGGADELLADRAPHRAAHEEEVHHRELERVPLERRRADDHRVREPGVQLGLGDPLACRAGGRRSGAGRPNGPPRRPRRTTRGLRARRSVRARASGSGGRTGHRRGARLRARRRGSATRSSGRCSGASSRPARSPPARP